MTIQAKEGSETVTEGDTVEFTLTRGPPTEAPLTVNLEVTETRSMIETSGGYEPPEEVEFRTGQETATLEVLTDNDDIAESTEPGHRPAAAGSRVPAGPDFDPERPGDGPGQRSLGPSAASPSSSTATTTSAAASPSATTTSAAATTSASSAGCDGAHGTAEPAGRSRER